MMPVRSQQLGILRLAADEDASPKVLELCVRKAVVWINFRVVASAVVDLVRFEVTIVEPSDVSAR